MSENAQKVIDEILTRACERRCNHHPYQPTGGQPTPELVVEALAESWQIPAWVPAFERAWASDGWLIVQLVPASDGERIYRSAFQMGWMMGRENCRAENCGRMKGFDPDAAREKDHA